MNEFPSVNVDVDRLTEVVDVIRRLRATTGMEPVLCVHIYAESMDDLREALMRGDVPGVQTSFAWEGSPNARVIQTDKDEEPMELQEAREKLRQWSAHSATTYTLEQRRFWRDRVDALFRAHMGGDAPPDETEDAS